MPCTVEFFAEKRKLQNCSWRVSLSNHLLLFWQEKEYNLLVIGIPNVGKSSLINLLRKNKLKKAKNATHVAPQAGVTRSVLEKIKVHNFLCFIASSFVKM